MAKKQVYGVKRGLCPVCGEQIQHVKFVNPITAHQNKTYKFDENVVKVCKCPGKTLNDYMKM